MALLATMAEGGMYTSLAYVPSRTCGYVYRSRGGVTASGSSLTAVVHEGILVVLSWRMSTKDLSAGVLVGGRGLRQTLVDRRSAYRKRGVAHLLPRSADESCDTGSNSSFVDKGEGGGMGALLTYRAHKIVSKDKGNYLEDKRFQHLSDRGDRKKYHHTTDIPSSCSYRCFRFLHLTSLETALDQH